MNKKKQVLAALGIASLIFTMFAVLVYAATWTPEDMVAYMQNVGRHKIYQTNWILYNQIGPKMGQGLQGDYIEGTWLTSGVNWTDDYVYDPSYVPKKFSFWVNLFDMNPDDQIVFDIYYQTYPLYYDLYQTKTFTGAQTFDSVLLVDQLPIGAPINITATQTLGNPETFKYHAIIEEN